MADVARNSLEEACEGCHDSPPSMILQNEWRLACTLPCAIVTCTRTSALVYSHPDEDVCSLTGNVFIDVIS
jgi:hypothetical protein